MIEAAWLVLAVGTAASAFGSIGVMDQTWSVRESGMGGLGGAAGDVLGTWTNPAACSQGESRYQVGAAGEKLHEGAQSGFTAGGGGRIWSSLWAAALLGSSSVRVPEVDEVGTSLGTDAGRSGFDTDVAAAWRFGVVGAAGVGVKWYQESLAGVAAGGIAVDAGALARWGGVTLGVAGRNLGGEDVNQELRADALYDVPGPRIKAGAFVAMLMAPASGQTAGGGAEWSVVDQLVLRGGAAVRANGLGAWSLGLTAGFAGMNVDYAYAGRGLFGPAHRVALRYQFGR